MASSKDTMIGTVVEALPNNEFKIEFDVGQKIYGVPVRQIVRCYVSGKMRHNSIHVVIGDKVECVVPAGSSIGRIVRRK